MTDTGPNFGPIIWRNGDDIQEAQAAREEAQRIIGELDAQTAGAFDRALEQHIRHTQ